MTLIGEPVPFGESKRIIGAPLRTDPPDKQLAGRSVLVVEDEMLVLMATEDMLADLGCDSIMTAATVDQALGLIDEHFVDMALLDVNLNGERSFPIADALAARDVPFAFATGYGFHGLREADRKRPVLMKPYRIDELAQMLRGLVLH